MESIETQRDRSHSDALTRDLDEFVVGWIGGARFIDCAASGGLERADNLK